MFKNKLVHFVLPGVATLLFCLSSFAQDQTARNGQDDRATQRKTIVLNGKNKLALEFTIRSLGSVSVQVFQKVSEGAIEEPRGISGFRVRVRSKDRGYENWYLDQFTDADGVYTFECLRPGNYLVELDPAEL